MKNEKINGFISLENREYSIFLDGNNLYGNLLSDTRKINLSFNKKKIPFIKAKYSLGGTIAFYNFVLSNQFIDGSVYAQSYGVFLSRSMNKIIDEYDVISFKGKAINNFYPPALCVEGIDFIDFPNEDGSKTIKLKPFLEKTDEIEVKIYDKIVRLQLTVCTPGSIVIDSTNLGEIYTEFKVIFQEKMPLDDLLKWVLAIKKIFAFLNFRNDIAFDEIELLENTNNGFDKLGILYLYESFQNDIPHKSKKCVSFLDIKNNFRNLLLIILDENLNLLCLPKNKQDSWLVTPEKYVFTSAGFENVFNKIYFNYVNDDAIYSDVKQSIINFLETEDEKYKGKSSKHRDCISKFKNTIERESKNLSHKFNKCLIDYDNILAEFIIDIKKRYNINSFDKMKFGNRFSSVRNNGAHGSKIEYDDEAIIAFELARVMIYISVFKLAEFTDEKIKKFIKILFIDI